MLTLLVDLDPLEIEDNIEAEADLPEEIMLQDKRAASAVESLAISRENAQKTTEAMAITAEDNLQDHLREVATVIGTEETRGNALLQEAESIETGGDPTAATLLILNVDQSIIRAHR